MAYLKHLKGYMKPIKALYNTSMQWLITFSLHLTGLDSRNPFRYDYFSHFLPNNMTITQICRGTNVMFITKVTNCVYIYDQAYVKFLKKEKICIHIHGHA